MSTEKPPLAYVLHGHIEIDDGKWYQFARIDADYYYQEGKNDTPIMMENLGPDMEAAHKAYLEQVKKVQQPTREWRNHLRAFYAKKAN